MRCFPALILLAAGVPALAATPRGMFELYAANRADGRPNLITEDFLLLGYAMTLDRAMAEAEEQVLLPESLRIVEGLKGRLGASAGSNRAAKEATDFLTVVHALLAGEERSEPAAVAAELQRVRAAGGIARSGLMLQNLDYSQFRPRGRYTRTPALQRYFQGSRYAGTVLFPVVASRATGISDDDADRLTAEALLLGRALRQSSGIAASYSRINQRLSVLFGLAEDLTAADLSSIGAAVPVRQARSMLLERARRNQRQPAILAAPVDVSRLERGLTAADALTGWRLFPLRYTPDSAAMQQLVYDHVKGYKGSGHPESLAEIAGQRVKGFPLAHEVMALLGSEDAVRALDLSDERNYEGYGEAFQKASAGMKSGTDMTSRQLRMVSESFRSGDAADSERRLGSALGFWTWIRYNNFLYSKQSYTASVKGIPAMKPRDKAWLEPSALYPKLAAQLDDLKGVLPGRGLTGMAQLLRRCAEVSKEESAGGQPSAAQAAFLNGLDFELLKLTGGPDRPIIVDVHTEPNSGLVLEEALGFPGVASHELDGSQTATGARFTHREFKQSIARRLNDDEWLTMLEKEELVKETWLPERRYAHEAYRPRLIRVAEQTGGQAVASEFSILNREGMGFMSEGRWDKARQAFERAFAKSQNERQAAQASARIGEALGKLNREREGIEYLQRSLEIFHYDQVEDELKEMRLRLLSRTQTEGEIRSALADQLASKRGTRVLPARPLMLKVLFDFDKATLTPEGRDQVRKLGQALGAPDLRADAVKIVGHTDLTGSDSYNQVLSERRAEAVASEIVRTSGIPRSRFVTEGRGMREPLYAGTGTEESTLNRRVEVSIAGP